MTKEITVAELKDRLEESLEEVRNGATLRVIEGDRALVEIVPTQSRADRSKRLGDFRLPPLDPPLKTDGLGVLLELRQNDRRR